MCKKIRAIAKVNMKNIKLVYIMTAIFVGMMGSNYVIDAIIGVRYENEFISIGWTLWLLPVFAAILIPSRGFRRTANLGGKRDNFLWGALTIYAVLAGVASIAGVILHYTEIYLVKALGSSVIYTAPQVFGWLQYGPVVAFFQQFAFLLLFATFTHTLTAAQDKWYGWAADVVIVAIISVFPPIAVLRGALAGFFRLILFENAPLQIAACMVLALAIYALNKVIFARKTI